MSCVQYGMRSVSAARQRGRPTRALLLLFINIIIKVFFIVGIVCPSNVSSQWQVSGSFASSQCQKTPGSSTPQTGNTNWSATQRMIIPQQKRPCLNAAIIRRRWTRNILPHLFSHLFAFDYKITKNINIKKNRNISVKI